MVVHFAFVAWPLRGLRNRRTALRLCVKDRNDSEASGSENAVDTVCA